MTTTGIDVGPVLHHAGVIGTLDTLRVLKQHVDWGILGTPDRPRSFALKDLVQYLLNYKLNAHAAMDDATATAELLERQYVLDTVFPPRVFNQVGQRKAWVIELYQVIGRIRWLRHARIERLRRETEEAALQANQEVALWVAEQRTSSQ